MRNLSILNALRNALKLNQFELYYQPQINLEIGEIVGAEALIRWRHPEMGVVSPGEFIPIAEESGLITAIGDWVLKTAIRQTKIWKSEGTPIRTAINLSAIQFKNSELTEQILNMLKEVDLEPNLIELELTESMAMYDPSATIYTMSKMYGYGIRLSIDDFGTGHSCLSYVKKFKVYKLKIDQSFVREMCTSENDQAIITAILALSKSLKITTIAEGVETSD